MNEDFFTSADGRHYEAEFLEFPAACVSCAFYPRARCSRPRQDPNEPSCRADERNDGRHVRWKEVTTPRLPEPEPNPL